jgi:chromosome segregation ATPase
MVAWLAVATATVAIDFVGGSGTTHAVVIQKAYQARLEELAGERDQRAIEARSAQARFQTAMKQISRQQTALLQSVEQRRELTTALDLMQQRVQDAVNQRDGVTEANDRLLAQINDVSKKLSSQGTTDLTETLETVSGALSEAVAARDAATAERTALTQELADLQLRVRVNTQRQDEMVDQLEQAVAMSFGPLEKLIKTAKLDVDGLIATVRSRYSGQ